jgi:hypothetical protein
MTKDILVLISVLIVFSVSCKNSSSYSPEDFSEINNEIILGEHSIENDLIKTRIQTPSGYERSLENDNSFQEYLRNLKLKPEGSLVKYFDGNTKSNNDIYQAVIDLDIGDKNLHQCADAVMRLRAEYLWYEKKYNQIHFNFTNGHKVEYKKWMNGHRMNVKGNKTWWSQERSASNTYDDFWEYMELIFMYAGTASLEKELIAKNVSDAQIGDVLIQGGHPGHAVIIVDKAIETETGQTIYLLAQSYMPAQEIQILKNPTNVQLSPWYSFNDSHIVTPEWTFTSNDLMYFND